MGVSSAKGSCTNALLPGKDRLSAPVTANQQTKGTKVTFNDKCQFWLVPDDTLSQQGAHRFRITTGEPFETSSEVREHLDQTTLDKIGYDRRRIVRKKLRYKVVQDEQSSMAWFSVCLASFCLFLAVGSYYCKTTSD